MLYYYTRPDSIDCGRPLIIESSDRWKFIRVRHRERPQGVCLPRNADMEQSTSPLAVYADYTTIIDRIFNLRGLV